MMEATNWQVPVTADGAVDVRVGDEWKHGADSVGTVTIMSPVRRSRGVLEVCALNEGSGYWVVAIKHLTALISRDGKPWDVSEGRRKGRWVPRQNVPIESARYIPGGTCEANDPVWLPDLPAKVADDEIVAGKVGRKWGMVFCPAESVGYMEQWELECLRRGFAGYWYPTARDASTGKPGLLTNAPVLYLDGNDYASDLYCQEFNRATRPTHVVFMEVTP